MDMRKRVLALLLAACLSCGVAPATAWADAVIRSEQEPAQIETIELPGEDTDADGLAMLEAMEKQSQQMPAGFDDDTKTLTPYGTGSDENFTIVEKPQLYSLDSADLDKSGTVAESIAKGSGLSGDTVSLIPKDKVLTYMEGASFDPTGCGRRNYIGVVGYDANSGEVKVYALNAQQKTLAYEVAIAAGDKTAWLREKNSSNKKKGIDTADAMNFFQVTSGDYDHDGKDSLIVYGGSFSNATDALWEVTYDGSKWQATSIDASALLNPSYFKAGMQSSKELGNRLGVSLATGDVNGDGTDDLVVVSATGKRTDSYKKNGNASEACRPYLAVAIGEKGKSIGQLKKDGQTIDETVDGTNRTMAATGVSVGDIDGNGVDEIVAAGFMNYWSSKNPTNFQTGSTKNSDKVAYAYFTCDVERSKTDDSVTSVKINRNGGVREISGSEYVSRISQGSSVRTDNATSSQMWQQFSVECVAFDGIDSPEYVFLNGYVFKLKSNSLEPVMNDQLFNKLVLGNFDSYKKSSHDFIYKPIDENFVYSAAVGNFSGSENGVETLVLSMGYKIHGQSNYCFARVVISKNAQGKFEVTKPDLKTYKGDPYLNKLDECNDSYGKRLNHLVVAVDKDYDSVVGRYSGRSFAYTDPNVAAVLQAAPYFKELANGESNLTTYEHAESLTRTEGESRELSYSIGRAAGTTVGPVSTEVAKTYSQGFSQEYTESVETEYSSGWSCGAQNQVLVRRTLVYYYYYDVLNQQGGFDKSALVIAVPQKPVMSQLSVEQYNELAKAYNAKYGTNGHKMDEITDSLSAKYFLDNEGDPFAYPSSIHEPSFGGDGVDLSNNELKELGHAGGSTDLGCKVSTVKQATTTASDGMEAQISVELSAGASGIPFVGEASVKQAHSKSVEKVTRNITTTSQMSSKGVKGVVTNLGSDDALARYYFTWTLAGWKGGDDLFKGVLFVGYVVTSQDAPVAPVTDLAASYAAGTEGKAGSVILTWTSPRVGKGRRAISGFDVYRKDGSTYTKLNSTPIANAGELKAQLLTVEADPDWGFEATFVVRSLCEASGYDSIYSNEVRCILMARVGLGGDSASGEKPVDMPAEPTVAVTAPVGAEEEFETMMRLYNPWSGEHLFTTDVAEVANLVPLGWQDEGGAWKAPRHSDAPVWRLYNPYSGDHHYTASEEEYDQLGSIGWNQEGVGFYSAGTDGQAIYRLFNPWLTQGTHLYTTDATEYGYLGSIGWSQEGVAFYGA